MRTLILAAAALLLSACANSIVDRDPSGLSDPPYGSAIPAPHG
jgi:hypothetical protein